MSRTRSNPWEYGLPDDVLVWLDVAMDAGIDLSGLVEELERTRGGRSALVVVNEYIWRLSWKPMLPELPLEKLLDTTEAALEERRPWDKKRVEAHDGEHASPQGRNFIYAVSLDGFSDDYVGNENWGEGSERFDAPFSNDSFRDYDEGRELDFQDRFLFKHVVGVILDWDNRGFYEATLFTTPARYRAAWEAREQEFAHDPEEEEADG